MRHRSLLWQASTRLEQASTRLKQASTGILLLSFLLVGLCPLGVAAQEESSPIEIELIVPQQAGPGEIVDVLIKYDVVDLNAGADINYNLFGPARIWTRDPEPPNPLVNTWLPKWDSAQGTITVQVRIDEGTDGQTLQHQVEVRWGVKVRTFDAQTLIKYVPPTPTPSPTPRPRPSPTTQPAQPTSTVTPGKPTLNLTGVTFLNLEGQPLSEAESNQEFALGITYASSGDLENVTIVVRFEPDVVNLDGLPRTDEGYTLSLPIAAAPDGADLLVSPPKGRIRPYGDGGELYVLRAVVQIQVPEGATANVPGEFVSEPLQVSQSTLVVIEASVDTDLVRTGGSIIVHALCKNLGQAHVKGLRLEIAGLPEGFAVSPGEQVIAQIDLGGGSDERLFTIHTPENLETEVTFKVVGALNEEVIESEPVVVRVIAPVPLDLEVSADRSTVRAGETFYVNVTLTNRGRFAAQGVTAKLIDTTDNLGVLLQDVGDIAPSESVERVFAATIPEDFPADVLSSLIVQTISEDGTVTESSPPISIEIACVPGFEVHVQPPAGRLRGGQSIDAVVVLRNVSQCIARDVFLAVEGLPEGFAIPPEQRIVELAPGEVRYLTFNLLIPEGYQGGASFVVRASDSTGVEVQAPPSTFSVGGASTVFTVIFGFLVLLAIAAIVVGVVLYFRQK